jgi:ABC-2 type transport system ATP-binding protein
MISVENLSFEYPGVRALDGVSLTVKRGSVVALVGPNGAGKTTLLRCLAALDQPVSGQILLDGESTLDNPRLAHEKIGYLPDFFGLYDDLTVERCLMFHAASHNISKSSLHNAVHRAAERLGLAERLHVRAKELSRGLRQRLAIAQAIVHEPPLLLLDEPASGLDPEARASLSELFLELRDTGITLIVSSHILTELQAYSSHMLVMRQGRIVAEESVKSHSESKVRLHLSLLSADEKIANVLSEFEGVSEVHVETTQANFLFAGGDHERHHLLKHLLESGFAITSFSQINQGMQDAYLAKVRKGGEQ